MIHKETEKPEKNSIKVNFALLIPVALGMIILGDSWRFLGGLGLALTLQWLWKQYQRKQQAQLSHLNTVFYQLIKKNKGRMTPLDLAMSAKVTGKVAQDYLEQRVREFSPHFEVTEQGGIIYYFESVSGMNQETGEPDLLLDSSPPSVPIEITPPQISPPISSLQLPNFSPKPQPVSGVKSPQLFPLNPQPLEPPTGEISYNQIELAQRLQVHPNTVSKWKLKSDFIEWSGQLDPEGISWVYSPDTKRFYPLKS